MTNSHRYILILIVGLVVFSQISSAIGGDNETPTTKKDKTKPKGRKLPKDPMYITDIDLENLYDEWEEADEEKLPPDELPPHKRQHIHHQEPGGSSGAGRIDDELLKDPEKLMRATKKGKTVMAFVTIDNKPTREETELLTQRWQVGLTNNHMKCERFVIADDRAIFVFEDGSLAFEAKDFFIEQPELKEYSIDSRVWHGRASLARNEECPWDANEPGRAKSESCKNTKQ